MLEIRPVCEHCNKPLPNDSNDAMICSFECTFCKDCVNGLLNNVCPNCGGGFEKRPVRPANCLTGNCISNYPAVTIQKHRPVHQETYKIIQDTFVNIAPDKR